MKILRNYWKVIIPCQKENTKRTNIINFSKGLFSKINNEEVKETSANDVNRLNKGEDGYKKLFNSFNDFDQGFDKFLKEQKDNSKINKTVRIIEIDMTKDKSKSFRRNMKEYKINPYEADQKDNFELFKEKEDYVIGINDKYPIENFINLKSTQFNKEIKLCTYKFPAFYNSEFAVEKECLGVIYLCHGLYEYSDLTANMAKYFSSIGYDVLAMDIRGHGRSEGVKGLIENRKGIIGDYESFINQTIDEYRDKSKYMMGYSLGGLISTLICKDKPIFNGAIILAGAMENESIPSNLRFTLKLVKMFLSRFPKFSVPTTKSKLNIFKKSKKNKVNPTSNPAVLKYYEQDPLRYKGKFKIGTAITIDELLTENLNNVTKISTPMYFVQGRKDKLVSYDGNMNYLNKLSNRKVIVDIQDLEHDIPHDYRIRNYLEDIFIWMKENNNKN